MELERNKSSPAGCYFGSKRRNAGRFYLPQRNINGRGAAHIKYISWGRGMRNKADIIIYYDVCFTSLRMLVGALSAVYLLNHGVSLVNIGLMKSMQSVIYFCFDIPSSYLADKYSRKAAVIIATLLGGLWLLITGLASSVPLYFLAEAFNALSLTIIGGVIQAYIIDNADDLDNIHRIMGRVNKLSFFFMAVSSLIGAYLATLNDRLPWLIGGAGCFILAAVFAARLPRPIIHATAKTAPETLAAQEKQAEENFSKILARLFAQKAVLAQAVALMGLAISFQLLLQYWQLIVQFPQSAAFYYGLLFFAILMAQSAAGALTARLKRGPAQLAAVFALLWLCLALLSAGIYAGSNGLKIAALVPLFGLLQIGLSFSGARFHTMIISELRSTTESMVSSSAKFLVMILMPLIAFAAARSSWLWLALALCLLMALATALSFGRSGDKS